MATSYLLGVSTAPDPRRVEKLVEQLGNKQLSKDPTPQRPRAVVKVRADIPNIATGASAKKRRPGTEITR